MNDGLRAADDLGLAGKVAVVTGGQAGSAAPWPGRSAGKARTWSSATFAEPPPGAHAGAVSYGPVRRPTASPHSKPSPAHSPETLATATPRHHLTPVPAPRKWTPYVDSITHEMA
jgi:hypothetical protein